MNKDYTVTMHFPCDLRCLVVIGGRDERHDGHWKRISGSQWKRGRNYVEAAFKSRDELAFCLAVMDEIDRACPFNILHVCDYQGGTTI